MERHTLVLGPFRPRKGAHSIEKWRTSRAKSKFTCFSEAQPTLSRSEKVRSRFLSGCLFGRSQPTTSSTNDVVEHPLPERPVEQARNAIPPREPPLRDEASFYAPVEPPSARHHLRKEVILGWASTGPQGLLPGAARTGDNFPRTSTFRTRAFCPRKGAHSIEKWRASRAKSKFTCFSEAQPTLSRSEKVRSHFLSGSILGPSYNNACCFQNIVYICALELNRAKFIKV